MALVERYVTTTGAGTHDGTSEANAFTWAEAITDSVSSAVGTRYNVKNNATYSRTTSVDSGWGNGSTTAPKILRGYNTTPGDGYLGRSGTTGELITTNFPTISYSSGRLNTGTFWVVECLNITRTNNDTAFALGGSQGHFIFRCRVSASGTSSGGAINQTSTGLTMECDIFQTAGSGGATALNLNGGQVWRSRIKSTSGPGLLAATSAGGQVKNCLIYQCGTDGISCTNTTGPLVILDNTIVANTGDGIDLVASHVAQALIEGNMITDNGAWGINFNNTVQFIQLGYNRFRDNVSGQYSHTPDWVTATDHGNVTTDTGGPSTDYNDTSTLDWTLIAQSPGVSAAWPYSSMGAYQRLQTVSVSYNPLGGTIVESR